MEEEDESRSSSSYLSPRPHPPADSHSRNLVHRGPLSEDGTVSVMSLSDKYRQQEEMEVFEEFYMVSPREEEEEEAAYTEQTQSTGAGSAE